MAQPVWTRPVWITAMVGLVSAFLTIPQIVGDYLTNQQKIKIAEQETEAIRLKNIESQQDQEFKIVSNTLAQQGKERIFVLRYLAATLDDDKARQWAEGEVNRLDELAILKEKAVKDEEALRQKQEELDLLAAAESSEKEKLKLEINKLKTNLVSTNATVIQQQEQAGFRDKSIKSVRLSTEEVMALNSTISLIGGNGQSMVGKEVELIYNYEQRFTYKCSSDDCMFTSRRGVPGSITITPGDSVIGVEVYLIGDYSYATPIGYRCRVDPSPEISPEMMVCFLVHVPLVSRMAELHDKL